MPADGIGLDIAAAKLSVMKDTEARTMLDNMRWHDANVADDL
jgi:isocitrate/isopropylmalate dehydrogenase